VWKDKQHPLRQHPKLRLTGIPTLLRWRSGGGSSPGARLGPELEAAGTEAEADALIRQFLAEDWQGPAQHSAGEGVDVQALMQQLQGAGLSNGAAQT
jgi:hypothetical protein